MSDHQSPAPPMVVLNPDGSYTRIVSFPSSLPIQDSNTPVLSKDVVISDVNKTWARIYVPKETLSSTVSPVKRLPVVFYCHGGGFILMSAASTLNHDFCDKLAAFLPAVVVSLEYRLAPEHRLPAAYEDAMEALLWIKTTQDPWLTQFADLSDCYLMGTSAGANLAYNAGVRASLRVHDLEPLKIKGLILHHLFVGGVERTGSEIRLADAGQLSLSMCDGTWSLCLPVGASRDHEYCNPMAGGGPVDICRMKEAGWRVMVAGCYGDLLIDRQMGFAKMLELKGVETECFYGEGEHGIELYDKSKAYDLFNFISRFIVSSN